MSVPCSVCGAAGAGVAPCERDSRAPPAPQCATSRARWRASTSVRVRAAELREREAIALAQRVVADQPQRLAGERRLLAREHFVRGRAIRGRSAGPTDNPAAVRGVSCPVRPSVRVLKIVASMPAWPVSCAMSTPRMNASVSGRSVVTHRAAEDRVIAQRAEGLAGHERIEPLDPARRHERPLRVRARQADQRAVRLVVDARRRWRARRRSAFPRRASRSAARRACSTPGTICTRRAVRRLHPARCRPRARRRIGRRLDVRRFHPALRAADHAGRDHRQRRRRLEPRAAGFVERLRRSRLPAGAADS